jgi:hypothetical protein
MPRVHGWFGSRVCAPRRHRLASLKPFSPFPCVSSFQRPPVAHYVHTSLSAFGLALVATTIGYSSGAAGQQTPALADSARVADVLNPTNAERIATDYDTRSHDYDLIHQRIEVSNFNWDSTSFDGRVATELVARRPGLDSVVLDAGSHLTISRVVTPGGASLTIGRQGDTLVVHLAHAVAFGDTVRFIADYHAHIDNGHGLTFIQAEGRPHRPQQIWSQGESQDNHYWFPTYYFPDDKMTWESVATGPAR